jgi:hypothetical protein
MLFRLRVRELDDPLSVVYMKILRHYGAGCYPKKPLDRGEYWSIPIDAYYPKIIQDEKSGRERILTFYLDNIAEIHVQKENLKIIQAPTQKNMKDLVLLKRAEIRSIVEKDLIKILGDPKLRIKFGKLKFALFGLQPVYRTIISLLDEQFPTYVELEEMGYIDLINLIVDLGYASFSQEQPKRLLPTSKLTELYVQMKSDVVTAEAFLGLMLANHYEYLAKTLRIIHFVPYVRVSTSYYGSAIEYGDLIRITEKKLRRNIHEYYWGTPSPTIKKKFGIPTLVKELVEADVLEYDGPYITGREEIFNELIQRREELPMVEEPYFS